MMWACERRSVAKPTFIDLFAGAGGFTRGFVDAGFRPLLAVENHPASSRSYAANFPDVPLLAEDVKRVDAAMLEEAGMEEGDADVVIGGPPCEPYTRTNAGRRRTGYDRLYKDPVGGLVLHFARIVKLLKPRAFVMENVAALSDDRELRRLVADEFRVAGHRRTEFNILRAEDAGVPSKRRRLFASNLYVEPTTLAKPPTVRDAIGDLPPPGPDAGVANHVDYTLSRYRRNRIGRLKPGQALVWFPGAEGQRFPQWLRLGWDDVAPTVMGSSRFVHPEEDRALTPREHARLMGYPDEHVFVGSPDNQFEAVGESVPPPLARFIADAVASAMK